MKLHKIIVLVIAPVLLILSSCESEAKNVKLPDFVQKLVISSFISPADTVTYFTITGTQRNYGDLSYIEPIGNLTGFLSDGTREISLDTTKYGLKFYKTDMLIEDGKSYNLRVISDRGLTAEASCTVPVKRDFKIEMDTLRQILTDPGGRKYSSLSAEISITDFAGEANYYSLICIQNIYGVPYWDNPVIIRLTDYSDNYFNDKGKDGEKFLLRSLELVQFPVVDSSFLSIFLFNTDKAYYDFHKSLINYSDGENPFIEASPIYSNITGGIGIFASYTVDSLTFRLK
jgi:hypothetical protein